MKKTSELSPLTKLFKQAYCGSMGISCRLEECDKCGPEYERIRLTEEFNNKMNNYINEEN